MLCTSPWASSVSGATPPRAPSMTATPETLFGHEPQLSVHLDPLESRGSCAAVSPPIRVDLPSHRLTPAECIAALVEPSCANASSHPLRIGSLIAASYNADSGGNALAFASHALTMMFEVLFRRMETQNCVHLDNAWAAAEFLAWIAEDYIPVLLDTVTTPALQMEALSIRSNTSLAAEPPHHPRSHIAKANRARIHAPTLLFLKRSNIVDTNTLKVWMHTLRGLKTWT
ncbi:hypothetical protein BC830DRAFT_63804 [Chytriomyces sp. MP71]|nr:hypothetical protein BC830DRAFT_63804 [Chytriomyces sp. MP71]